MDPIDVRSASLPSLFDPAVPNAPMLFGILEGRLPGRAIADDPHSPTLAAVQSAEGIAFISRTTTQAELDTALSGLRRDAMVGLAWPDDATATAVPTGCGVPSDTSAPLSITFLAARPSGVPAFTAARSMSPVEIWGMPKRLQMTDACVPLPAPGAPNRMSLMSVGLIG